MGYLLGRGPVYIGDRDATTGKPGEMKKVHCNVLEATMESQFASHYNSDGAVKALDLYVITQQEGMINITLDENDAEIFAMALGGEKTDVTTGATFTDLPFPATVEVGKPYLVPGGYSNLDTLTIEDSAGTPAPLSLGTNYTQDLNTGIITFVNISGFTPPFTASGEEKDNFEVVSIQTRGVVEKYVRFAGLNIAVEPNKPIVVDFYRVSFPPNNISLKNEGDEVNSFPFEAKLLKDETAPFDSVFGQYGRIVKP